MLTPNPTKSFKGEVQRIAARGRDITKMLVPLLTLLSEQPLPLQYKDHPLKGQWSGYREFHVESDWLVIYKVTDGCLVLARTGTHADLFKR